MALDQRRRQKKLERKLAKRKEQKRELAQRSPSDVSTQFRSASRAPVLHSLATQSLWTQGMGHVFLSREIGSGQVAFAAFLVDMYCLGVKDAMSNIQPRGTVETIPGKLSRGEPLRKLTPECARKLVEGAVEYARNLGFAPHEDYYRARPIFGDIDSAACAEAFEYGCNGNPHFIAGPYDSPARCQQILRTLQARFGPEGHLFTIPVAPSDLLSEHME